MKIILPPSGNKSFKELLEENKIYIDSPCGGIGKCGKCKILVLRGETLPAPDENGYVKACCTKPITECEVYIPKAIHATKTNPLQENLNYNTTSTNTEDLYHNSSDINAPEQEKLNSKYAICDIGTTNVKIREYTNGKITNEHFFRNPQCAFGGDVISRIANCKNGGYITQCNLIREAIASRIPDVDIVYICGNPTMVHIFACVDPSPIGVYPFECVFKETTILNKSQTGLPFDSVILPSASAYVGSDALTGVAMVYEKDKNILVADLGTNGEISLIKNGKVYSATTAAGPAIEGANMEMGVCGNEDVVYYVEKNGNPRINGKARGINAGGIFSLISYLLESKQLTSEGRFVKKSFENTSVSNNQKNIQYPLKSKITDNKFYITDNVYISQNDISEFMLAKSAVKTAIILLLKETNTAFSQIDTFILTGGLSTELSVETFSHIGLIPSELKEKATYIPNLAITATEKCTDSNFLKFVESLSENIETLSLSDSEDFEEEFILNTFFDN